MKLISQLPATSFFLKHRCPSDLEVATMWKSSINVAELGSGQTPFMVSGMCSKAEWIAHRHQKDIEGNHQENNLSFHGPTNRRSHDASSTLESPSTCSKHQHLQNGKRIVESKLPTKTQTHFGMKDLELISQEIRKVLCTKGLLKEGSFREVAIPGTYCQEDPIVDQVDVVSLKESEPGQIFEMATSSKQSSILVQCYIGDCCVEALESFNKKISAYYPQLMTHKFGSFVVQRLIAKHEPAFHQVSEISKSQFKNLILNEYSSRVIQLLVEKSHDFCDFTNQFFRGNFNVAITSSSACHLLVSSLKCSEAAELGSCILNHLRLKPILLANKFFHRVLLTYLQIATHQQLDEAAGTLGIEYRTLKLFNRKATNTILLTLIQREHLPTIEAVLAQLARSPLQVLETRYFTFSMQKLSLDKPSAFTRALMETLDSLNTSQVKSLSKKPVVFCQYVFTLLNSSTEDQRPLVSSFLERAEVRKPLLKILLKHIGKSNLLTTDKLLACLQDYPTSCSRTPSSEFDI